MMKKLLFAALSLLLAQTSVLADNPNAYFSAVCPSGQTLFYSIDANGRGASVTWPNFEDGDYWAGYTKPSGRIVIPDSVTWVYEGVAHTYPVYCVGQNCFNGCTGITTVVFPETIIAFEPSAFAGCTSMDSIIMPQVPPEVFAGQPIGMSDSAAFYIPCGTWQAYYDAHYNQIHTSTSYPPCLEPEADVTLTHLPDNPEQGDNFFITPGVRDYVRCDSVAMIYAQANYPYQFDHWSNGSTKIADTLIVTHDMTLTAFFRLADYEITAVVMPEGTGTVSGTGTYTYNETAILTANPAEGYHFARWEDYSTDNPREYLVDGDRQVIAYFAEGVGINDVDESLLRIFVDGNRIVVEGAEGKEVRIYSADGKQMKNDNLPTGVYLVQVGTLPAYKVMVKN